MEECLVCGRDGEVVVCSAGGEVVVRGANGEEVLSLFVAGTLASVAARLLCLDIASFFRVIISSAKDVADYLSISVALLLDAMK